MQIKGQESVESKEEFCYHCKPPCNRHDVNDTNVHDKLMTICAVLYYTIICLVLHVNIANEIYIKLYCKFSVFDVHGSSAV